jgi:hypothetical protein
MKPLLPLFIFIDACGWEIIKNDPFAASFAPHRRRLTSVFGYSSTCVPSILSGGWPDEHRNWSYFAYDPAHSPFRFLRPLGWLPQALTSRRFFRRRLSRLLGRWLGFRGYFDLYNMPFASLPLFNFTETKSPLSPGGMNRGGNIFDFLTLRQIAYHVSDPTRSETENLKSLLAAIHTESIDFAFVYWPDLDGLLHRVGNQSAEIPVRLRGYERRIQSVLDLAAEHYEDTRLYIFSDHGMANCDQHLDLKARIEALPLQMNKDYSVVYDSTMARFWFFREDARRQIVQTLEQIPQGRILPDTELAELRCLFRDRYFGELIFLVKEGVLIVPSHMGERPIRAMHGYHPSEPQSYAALLTNQPAVPEDIVAIPDIFKLMTRDAVQAKAANGCLPVPEDREFASQPEYSPGIR